MDGPRPRPRYCSCPPRPPPSAKRRRGGEGGALREAENPETPEMRDLETPAVWGVGSEEGAPRGGIAP